MHVLNVVGGSQSPADVQVVHSAVPCTGAVFCSGCCLLVCRSQREERSQSELLRHGSQESSFAITGLEPPAIHCSFIDLDHCPMNYDVTTKSKHLMVNLDVAAMKYSLAWAIISCKLQVKAVHEGNPDIVDCLL